MNIEKLKDNLAYLIKGLIKGALEGLFWGLGLLAIYSVYVANPTFLMVLVILVNGIWLAGWAFDRIDQIEGDTFEDDDDE